MLDEAAEIVRRMLTEDRVTFSGRHFQTDDASCLPKPVQARLPIWIGGVGERRTLEIAARRADGWNAAYVSPAEFGRLNKVLDHWCEVDDRDPATVRRGVNLVFAMAPDAAGVEVERERLAAEWGPAAERILGGTLLCTPDTAAERVLEYTAAGAQEVNIALRAPWNADALDAYLEETMPVIRREVA